METGTASRAVEHGRLEVVEDQVARTAAEKGQGVDQTSVELGFALRKGELDEPQAAIAEHSHKHRDFAPGRANLHAAAFAPIDLQRLGGFVMYLLVDAAVCRTDLTQVTAQDGGAAGITLRSAGDLLADAHGREVGIPGQQVLDLLDVRVQQAEAPRRLGRWRLLQRESFGHRVSRAVQSPRDHPAGKFFDLRQAANFGPQGDLHGTFLLGSAVAAAAAWRNRSPSTISPWPRSGRRLTPGDGSDSTWTNANCCAIKSRSSSSCRACSRTGCDSRNRLVSGWSL